MTRRLKKLAHSLYECKYHVVFCPKYRMRVLKDEIAEYVRQQIYQLCGQKDRVILPAFEFALVRLDF